MLNKSVKEEKVQQKVVLDGYTPNMSRQGGRESQMSGSGGGSRS